MTNHRGRMALLSFLALATVMGGGPQALGSEIAVVLSSDSPPYQEALQGFQEAYNQPVDVSRLSQGEPTIAPNTRLIVAIGGNAALYRYSGRLPLVYCLAPGLTVTAAQYAGPRINIHASVAMTTIAARLKEIQPSLNTLAVLWMSDSIQDYFAQQQEIARSGVVLRSERLTNLTELPDRLRGLRGQVDAIWLPADPLVITPQSFATVREFSVSNGIPLYVPTDNLVDKGASAGVSTSFREIGRTAAAAVKQALSEHWTGARVIYPQKCALTLNLTVAAQSGLTIPPAIIKKADRVVP